MNFVFNAALGSVALRVAQSQVFKLLCLKEISTKAEMRDQATVTALLGLAAVEEADFERYERVTLENVTATVSNADDEVRVLCDDVKYEFAGGDTNNIVKGAVIYVDNDDNLSTAVPAVFLDVQFETDGNDVTIEFHELGFYVSREEDTED